MLRRTTIRKIEDSTRDQVSPPAARLTEARRAPPSTGAGGDNGIAHDQKCLRFSYVFIVFAPISTRTRDLPNQSTEQINLDSGGPLGGWMCASADDRGGWAEALRALHPGPAGEI
jgi:hypothetical protein